MKGHGFGQHRTLACTMVAVAMLWCLPTSGTAAERQNGKATYERYCASCHGTAAKGDGPLASGLTTRPPDLTQFAKEAGGQFPITRVVAAIDGTTAVQHHGSADMPVWGERFRAETGSRTKTRAKVLSIAEYLRSIQVK